MTAMNSVKAIRSTPVLWCAFGAALLGSLAAYGLDSRPVRPCEVSVTSFQLVDVATSTGLPAPEHEAARWKEQWVDPSGIGTPIYPVAVLPLQQDGGGVYYLEVLVGDP